MMNPSMTGVENKHTAGAVYRSQWSKIEPSLQNFYGFYNTRLGENHGIGISGETYGTDNSQRSLISAQYSYQLHVKKDRQINFGIAPTYGSFALDADWVLPSNEPDPVVPTSGRSDHFLMHTGVSFTSSFVDIGFSVRNISLLSKNKIGYNFAPHYYGHLTLKVDVGGRSSIENVHQFYLDLIGASDAVKGVFQANARLILFDKLTLIGGYRTSNGLLVGAGWELMNKWRATYSLQLTKSDAFNPTLFTHEISLLFKIDHD